MVSESLDCQHRCACLVAQRSEDSASCIECSEIESRKILVRALLTVSGDESVYERRILGMKCVIVELVLDQRRLTVVCDEYICISNQFLEHFTAFRRLDIKCDTSFAGVLQIVGSVFLLIERTAFIGCCVSQRVSHRSLYLDDVGSEVGEESCCAWSSDKCRKLNDLDSLKRSSYFTHFFLLHYIVSMSRKVSRLVRTCSKCTICLSTSTSARGRSAASHAFLIIT